jgi:protein-L-isoaspartate(D-aspartate) O-methyltransferase
MIRTARRRSFRRAALVAALCVFGGVALAWVTLAGLARADLGYLEGGSPCDDPEVERYAAERRVLVERHIAPEIESEAVVKAMETVSRHLFVPKEYRDKAYRNVPLPIGGGQTISQPIIVAIMTYLLKIEPGDKVLEIGTGSGYQAAVLAELGAKVWSIEILPEVAELGAANLKAAGYADRVELRVGDGYLGWPEAAPFDGVIVTCAPDHVPEPLQEQLAEGGRLVIPVGEQHQVQELILIEKENGELVRRDVIPVRFVPMTGMAEENEPAEAAAGE